MTVFNTNPNDADSDVRLLAFKMCPKQATYSDIKYIYLPSVTALQGDGVDDGDEDTDVSSISLTLNWKSSSQLLLKQSSKFWSVPRTQTAKQKLLNYARDNGGICSRSADCKMLVPGS